MNRKHQLIYEDPDLTAFTDDELLEANHDIGIVIENMQSLWWAFNKRQTRLLTEYHQRNQEEEEEQP